MLSEKSGLTNIENELRRGSVLSKQPSPNHFKNPSYLESDNSQRRFYGGIYDFNHQTNPSVILEAVMSEDEVQRSHEDIDGIEVDQTTQLKDSILEVSKAEEVYREES